LGPRRHLSFGLICGESELIFGSSSNDVAVSNAPRKETTFSPMRTQQVSQDESNLLDGTRWKVMLNIGREAGTWMPKTWGISGERLLLNAEVEFTSE
jgi:hypothetical protein